MKIAYDDNGIITTVALDSEQVSGVHVAIVADNLDVFTYPAKYRYIADAFVTAPKLECVYQATAVVGASVLVSVRALALGGNFDATSTANVIVQHEVGQVSPENFNLVAGEGSFQVTSSSVGQVFLYPYSDGMFSGTVAIQFVAA
jgi:hypothetical protein